MGRRARRDRSGESSTSSTSSTSPPQDLLLSHQRPHRVVPVADRQLRLGVNGLALAFDAPLAVLGVLIPDRHVAALAHTVRHLPAVLPIAKPHAEVARGFGLD